MVKSCLSYSAVVGHVIELGNVVQQTKLAEKLNFLCWGQSASTNNVISLICNGHHGETMHTCIYVY